MKTTTVLWPSDLSPCEGICYGWTQPLLLVAGVVPDTDEEYELARVQRLVASAAASRQWKVSQDVFTTSPTIIGRCFPPSSQGAVADLHLKEELNIKGCIGDLQFVLYKRHRRQSMRFYAFDFNELDILPSQGSAHDRAPSSASNLNTVLNADFTRPRAPRSQERTSLDWEVLLQANFAQLLADLVDRQLSSKQLSNSSTSRVTTPRETESPPTPERQVSSEKRPSRFSLIRQIIGRVHVILRDFSTTADQLDVRFEQGVYVVGEAPHVYHDKARTVSSISKYIKFHNCVWLALNDIIIGMAFGSFLYENRLFLGQWTEETMQLYLVQHMELALLWLNNWPAGLKLNTELSQFYCHTLIGVVSAWGWMLSRAAPYFPALVGAIGMSGCFGMTMVVSLLSDTLSMLTAHLYACYVISATVFSQQLSLAGSLWNLFRGKRYNVLRNRIDTWDYDLDQLLLGTILFTLLAFLYPTVLTYYALFATARLAVMMIHAAFDTVTALLNHFPLFALLLRAKDPLRLPGGVCLQRSKMGSLILTSQPAPLSSIFRHYAHLGGRLTTHYHPVRMLRQLASGRLITPIPRSAIRYNMIPTKAKPDRPSTPS
ncbi:N-acetylglucosaminyl transferase component-domain-containing protein [Trametes maxima]|nr:N-acetylglucosaminyl transferase component-domain-containing protein [Trametes maxima]